MTNMREFHPGDIVQHFKRELIDDDEKSDKSMKKIAFICTHNSCRSQIAEAFGRHFGADAFESYSAGTTIKERINPNAVRLMKAVYGIDMEAEGQHPKPLADLPKIDIIVTMGCGVSCPFLPCEKRIDWGLEDPTGKDDEKFLATMEIIRKKILELKEII